MATAEIKKCSCNGTPAATFQDETYGKGMRVCNEDAKKGYKCTVCGSSVK